MTYTIVAAWNFVYYSCLTCLHTSIKSTTPMPATHALSAPYSAGILAWLARPFSLNSMTQKYEVKSLAQYTTAGAPLKKGLKVRVN